MQPEATSHKPAAEGTRSQKPKASQKPAKKTKNNTHPFSSGARAPWLLFAAGGLCFFSLVSV